MESRISIINKIRAEKDKPTRGDAYIRQCLSKEPVKTVEYIITNLFSTSGFSVQDDEKKAKSIAHVLNVLKNVKAKIEVEKSKEEFVHAFESEFGKLATVERSDEPCASTTSLTRKRVGGVFVDEEGMVFIVREGKRSRKK